VFAVCSVLTWYLRGVIWGKWKKVGKSGEKMFTGQYEHAVDQKGRVAVPVRFREKLEKGSVVTKGLDGCLFVFPKSKWESLAKSVGQLPVNKASVRLYSRMLLANAVEIEFDNQGRILIPIFLRKFALINSKVIFAGIFDRVEIWSKHSWDEMTKSSDKDAGKIVEELSDFNT